MQLLTQDLRKYQVRFHAAAEQDIADLLTELAPKAGKDTALRFAAPAMTTSRQACAPWGGVAARPSPSRLPATRS